MNSELVATLKEFGFTGQESQLYLALLRNGPSTGYELAKQTGISRSNAYAALASLVEKQAALETEESVKHFAGVPKQELVLQLRRKYNRLLNYLKDRLPEKQPATVPYSTVSGERNVVTKMRNAIDLAGSHIYLSMHSGELSKVRSQVENVVRRGIRTVILSDEDPGIAGATFRRAYKEKGHVKIIADTAKVFVANLSRDNPDALYSEEPHLVNLMREAMLNEIELIRIREGERE